MLIEILLEFYDYLKNIDTSESYQNGLLKVITRYTEHLGKDIKHKIKSK